MCCEQLVCASCARPVAEARCTICRAARSSLHHRQGTTSAAWLVLALVLLLSVAAAAYAHLGA